MAKIQFSLDGNSLGEFELKKERMMIGRRPVNDIHIDNLAVSGEHAAITTIGNDSFLEDLNSTNGTLVNNKPVKKHVLQHNDVIEFGKYQLLYINPAQANTPANHGGFENTVVMRPSKLNVASTENIVKTVGLAEQQLTEQANETPAEVTIDNVATEEVTTEEVTAEEVTTEKATAETATKEHLKPTIAAENAPIVGRLQMLNGVNSGREITLNKALTTLGKAGKQVSVITKRPHGYFLTHVEGENLPFINGLQIGLQAQALNHQDVIDLAGVKMEFLIA